jgi:hypothetical protein
VDEGECFTAIVGTVKKPVSEKAAAASSLYARIGKCLLNIFGGLVSLMALSPFLLAVVASNDRRITRAAQFLQRYKIDNLTNLWNVLKGEISIIGQRPELLEYMERYMVDYEKVLSVRPGRPSWHGGLPRRRGPAQPISRPRGSLHAGDPAEEDAEEDAQEDALLLPLGGEHEFRFRLRIFFQTARLSCETG